MALVVRMPEVLTGATEGALSAWLVSVGDAVTVGQPIAEVETEKATVEYEAEAAGTIAGLLVETDIQVSVGTPIAVLAAEGESAEQALAAAGPEIGAAAPAAAPEPAPAAAPTPVAQVPAPEAAAAAPATPAAPVAPAAAQHGGRLFMSPLVRRLAAERGLDLSTVTGSGPGGRIVRRDIESLSAPAPAAPTAPAAAPAAAADGSYTDVPHTGMRRAIARRLVESKSTVPHFYLVADCRVDALLEFRQRINETAPSKISVNDFVVKAAAAAFRAVPEANAIWTEDATRRFERVDIAVAVAIDGGLITPVVRGVERMSLSSVSASIKELAERGRAGKLKQDEIEGGSFSVSNLGMYGTQEFSAIINPPHAGILAVGAARKAPVVVDDEIVVGTVMTVTLSADHRVLDGALAAQWLAAFVGLIENPVAILV
ncbi:pyruvate dehydrogenase complex dihydrolipoamide acetyltransferase [Parafrigoribacterium humi]|jgi:pyruvate dehydrogenase E2 component (dihydrolipoamide acetyltransferase)|uniref:pyruvate dehydrogenase complex dihydrolipoamide acetyltransferase n=1 Tax=Parafrigoribacterium humi TaxID=3144664 RepID=UPI0032ECC86E